MISIIGDRKGYWRFLIQKASDDKRAVIASDDYCEPLKILA